MIKLIVISVAATAIMGLMVLNKRQSELEVVNYVDLARYAGRWFEIARLPNRFEKKVRGLSNGNLHVKNLRQNRSCKPLPEAFGGIHHGEGQGEDRRYADQCET